MKRFAALLILSLNLVTACSYEKTKAHERSEDFYSRYMNTEADFPKAEEKIENLKVLEVGKEYPIRLALFENSKVYYQIDKLGTGTGTWSYEGGALKVVASRPLFDMTMHVSGLKAEGDEAAIRFMDRHGFQSYEIKFRNPPEILKKGDTLPELKPYTSSEKNI